MNAILKRHALALVPTCFALASIFACSTTVNTDAGGNGCQTDSSVVCAVGAGYSCDTGDTPAGMDCSDGVVDSSGLTDYCCIEFTSSSCAQDDTVSGCDDTSYGFSCTGSDTPEDADSSLNCSMGVAGNAGSTLYCCQ
jgi:hypothetical protein